MAGGQVLNFEWITCVPKEIGEKVKCINAYCSAQHRRWWGDRHIQLHDVNQLKYRIVQKPQWMTVTNAVAQTAEILRNFLPEMHVSKRTSLSVLGRFKVITCTQSML
jgi:hypothetical protein